MKKFRITALLMILAFLLTACGGSKEQATEQEESEFDNRHIFREEDLELGDSRGNVTQFELVGDTLYVESTLYSFTGEGGDAGEISTEAVQETEEAAEEEATEENGEAADAEKISLAGDEGSYSRIVTAFDLEGNKKNEVVIELPANGSPSTLTVDKEGNIFSSYSYFGTKPDGSEDYRVYLQGHDQTGKELFTLWLNEGQNNDVYYYVNSIYCLEDGTLAVESGTAVATYDRQGNLLNQVEKEGEMGDCRLLQIREDQFAFLGMEGEKSFYQSFDIQTGQKGEKGELPFVFYAYSVADGKYYDVYLSNEKGIYGYNLGDAEPTPVMDFLGSDFSSYGMQQIQFIDEEQFIAIYHHDEGMGMGRFIHIPEEDVVEKAELVLGCYYLDSEIKNQVVKYNKENLKYRITVLDYSEYNTAEDYTIGQTRMNSDIASGNVPDIILLQSGMPLESYMAKGVFADYYELMEADAEFNREDYLPNLFEAYETDGKLYQMVPCFYIQTFVGKTADVGEDFSWTMDEALALQASKPEGIVLFPEVIQASFIQTCLAMNYEEYINWETGECFFDTDKFIQMLEYAKTLPKEYTNIDPGDEQAYLEMEMQYRDGKSLIAQNVLSSFRDYGGWKYATFGEDITMVGFPTETGIGSSFSSRVNLAISDHSKHKEAAWEFVKSLLSEEYQDSMEYYFPARLSSLEKLEQKAWENPYFLDENGNKVEYEQTYYIGNMEIKAGPLTKEETGVVMDFIKSIERNDSYSQELFNIISEEAQAFFAGQKTAKETADIIQSRARIYVNENR